MKKYISNYLLGFITGVIIIAIPTFIFNNIIAIDLDIISQIFGSDIISIFIFFFINSIIIGTIPFLLIFYLKYHKKRKITKIKTIILYYISFIIGIMTNYLFIIIIFAYMMFKNGFGF